MATNLEALAEEDDEEYDVMTEDSVSEDDEAGDGGVRKGEPNKFDGLCDGVVNATSLVHSSLTELLELKDELLKHALPPNVLMKIALCTTKVFRSVSDMQSPVNELIRMVRLYSTPWEEKSAALKKLHEDYNTKKEQLNIAIKRLQLIDAHSKRIEKERRIMNWEKLFSRLTTRSGHGRRWKFFIESFKKHAKEGPDSLRSYVDDVEARAQQTESEERDLETRLGGNQAPSVDPASDRHSAAESSSEEEEEEEGAEDGRSESGTKVEEDDLQSLDSAHKEQTKEVPVFIRPPMKDKDCWTHEPDYDKFLHIRVFKPENLDARELRCALTLGKQYFKSDILDPVPEDDPEQKPVSAEPTSADGGPSRPMRGRGRGRGPGGRGGGRPGAAKGHQVAVTNVAAREEEKKPDGPKYEEFIFQMDSEETVLRPHSKRSRKTDSDEPLHLKVSVHYGPKEEMIAMATIDFQDFESLELPTVYLKPPMGDPFPVVREEYIPTSAPTTPGLTATTETPETTTPDPQADPDKVMAMINDSTPINFPLYSLHAAPTEAMHMPTGQLPLVCYWAKKLRPITFDRATDSETVRDIVYDSTGFDMDVVSKSDLHKEMREQNLSAMSIRSEPTDPDAEIPPEPMVPKTQYDRLMNVHKEEMESLQTEYEQKLQDLVEQFQQIQEAMMNQQGSAGNSPHQMHRPESGPVMHDFSPVTGSSQPNIHKARRAKTDLYTPLSKPKKNFSIAKPLPHWGEHLPKDFLERLKYFEAESRKHQADISERQRSIVQDMLEKKFAAEFKLSNPDEPDFNAMEDVSLPAVFMPHTGKSKASVYNPRAAKYFHPSGAGGVRLTQPPSMLQLPPIPQNRLSVVNLFDVAQNFHRGGNQWLLERYMSAQQRAAKQPAAPAAATAPQPDPHTPPPTFATADALRDSALAVGAPPLKEAVMD